MDLPDTRFSRFIGRILVGVGNAVSWLWIVLLIVIVANVLMRYVLGEGRIEFEEIQWHLYSIGFMLGLGYAFHYDSHVRVDVLHERFAPETKAWIDLYGIVLFVLPFVALFLIFGIPFVVDSFVTNEVSNSPGGLPYRFLIKGVLLAGFTLLGLAAIARLTQIGTILFLTKRDDAG